MRTPTLLLVGCLSAALATAQTQAEPGPAFDPSWRFSGYFTLGHAALQSDTARRFARDQTQSQPNAWAVDSRVGLQLDTQLTPTLSATAQAVLRRRVPDTPAAESIEWAFLRWAPTPDWQLRLGRTSPDMFLFSDVRSVGVAYPWVRPSQEAYAWMPLQSVDGVDITRLWAGDEATWRLKFSWGQARSRVATQSNATPGDVKLQSVRTLSLARETPTSRVKLSYLRGHLDFSGAPVLVATDAALARTVLQLQTLAPSVAAEAEALRIGLGLSSPTQYVALGAQQDMGDWQATAEWSRVSGRSNQSNAQRHMLSLGRRIDAVTVFGVLGRSRPAAALTEPVGWQAQLRPLVGTTAAGQITGLGVATAQAVNRGRVGQHSVGLGARWDLRPNLALKAQWDFVRVDRNGRGLWALHGGTSPDDFRARVLTVTLDGSF